MVFELGDDSKVKNDANDIHCDVEFKTKVRAWLAGSERLAGS